MSDSKVKNQTIRSNSEEAKAPNNESAARHDKHIMPLWFMKSRSITYYILGIIEVLIAFRFAFKLLGANPRNGFIAFLYSVAGVFSAPFSGIFDPFVTSGLAAKSVFEPADIIAMVVYAVLAWCLVGLFRLIAAREGY